MPAQVFTGSISSINIDNIRTISLSGSYSVTGIATSVYAKVNLGTGNASQTAGRTVNVTVTSGGNSYSGSFYISSSSDWGGSYSNHVFTAQINVDSSFNINNVSQMTVLAASGGSYLTIKGEQQVEVNYAVPTKNGAPSYVSLSSTSANPGVNVTLSWGAGSAGTAGSIAGYKAEYAESTNGGSSWGGWQDLTTTSSRSYTVTPASTFGYKRKYRVMTVSGLDNDYNSNYTGSNNILTTNSPTVLPTPSTASFASTTANPNTSIQFNWSAVAGQNMNNLTGYEVQHRTSSNGGTTWSSWSSAGEVTTGQSYAIPVPSSYGNLVQARVRAQGSAGSTYYSSWKESSNTVTANSPIQQTPPSAFSLAKTLADPGAAVTLSWSGAAHKGLNSITGYELQYATSSDGTNWGNWTSLTTVESTETFGSRVVYASNTYGVYTKYQVRVRGSAGASYYSAWKGSTNTLLSRTPTACTAPNSITLDASVTNPGVATTLRWAGAAGGTINAITKYRVEYSDSDDLDAWGSWSSVGEVATSEDSIEVTSPTTNGRYRKFRVQAQGQAGSNYYSPWAVSAVYLRATPITKCGAPTSGYITPTTVESSATMFWSGASDGVYNTISGYGYQYADSTDGVTYSSWSSESSIAITETSGDFTVSAPSTRGAYRKFRIRTRGSAGSSYYSDWYEIQTVLRKNSAPTTPTVLSFNPTVFELTVRMQWSGAAPGVGNNIASYTLAYSTSENGTSSWSSEALVTGITNTYYDLVTSGITRGHFLRFRVLAVGSGELSSEYSNYSTNAKRNSPPNQPLLVTVPTAFDPGNTNFTVGVLDGGDPDSNTVGYEVALQYTNGAWYGAPSILLRSTGGVVTELSVNGASLNRGEVFYVAVRAHDALGQVSTWRLSAQAMTINPLQSIPLVVFPESGKTTYNQRPRFGFKLQPGAAGKTFSFKFTFNGVERSTNDDYATEFSKMGDTLAGNDPILWRVSEDVGFTSVATSNFRTNDGVADLPSSYRPASRTVHIHTTTLTDPTLTANLTQVKAAHINELRVAINTMRSYYGLSQIVWGEPIVAGTTNIKAVHIEEMRAAIDAIITYVNAFDPSNSNHNIDPISWTDVPLAGATIKAVHIQEIRNAIITL